ncbi:F0F1 ATP synthase subunit A [Myroides marinus]|jgi:F-type H+-transporting ATPase subunit a|uniref:ATP synthase subunit a n=1 Tax=Myroides marinus TaxID=703342 RepID=A0A161SI45_9FLAO|nr:F0F1 ATP synthase subunit A [Myroides marinus]KZE81255.1 ATP synthase F0 subunit A [Myroides marinus]MDM1346346.1 F0F1 ATP synthase subunit A [Myroides marinus]MDM1351058.1 F0F1 ATP synthase subunit A [Myroides marinus]MDM1353945.1 F0F1 ATP synthase subunit A [Myroides marinus]MDM1358301.1 F0F1 ATP synthase subunit A [Myroides marinus]
MVTLKKSLNLLAAVIFTASSVFSYAQSNAQTLGESVQETEQSLGETINAAEVADHEHEAEAEHVAGEKSQAEKVQDHITHHLADDYSFIFFSDEETGKHYGFSLPVILIDNGLKVFMSSEFDYGNKVVEKDGQHYKLYHGKIYKTDAEGTISYDEAHHPTNEKPLDFSITKNVASLLFTTVLIFLMFLSLAKTYKKGPNNLPKGFARALEPMVLYVRDEMAVPNIGKDKYKKFMPYLLSVFFLIFLLNLLGLTPLGFNVTGSISVTACLAIFTFIITQFSANKDYWKHMFWMPGVPVPMKIMLAPIEILGALIKPFSLMVRLFANITAGHSVVFGLIAIIFVMKEALGTAGAVGIGFFLSTFLVILEILVAFLQAFIFTMLSSLFIGMAVAEHEHDEAHH